MNHSSCSLAVDDTFGPQVASCRSSLDFTELFEDAILCIGPSVIFVILGLIRLSQLKPEKRRIWDNSLQWKKWVSARDVHIGMISSNQRPTARAYTPRVNEPGTHGAMGRLSHIARPDDHRGGGLVGA